MTTSGGFPPRFWHDRAEEVRNRAEEMHDRVAKITLELVAEAYDGLAERAQTRVLGDWTQPGNVN